MDQSPETERPHEVEKGKSTGAEKKKNMRKSILILARDIAIAVVIALIVSQFIKPTIVNQHSMENTLHPRDYIFVARQAYTFGEVERGDIVVFRSNLEEDDGTKKNLIKRVIGLSGDTIEIKDGFVIVNGEGLYEPYTKDGTTAGVMDEITVPEGTLFLMGDNRFLSRDSRDPAVGFVSKDELLGKAIFRVFPFSDFGTLK